jgi:hypothetical protein
MVFCFIGAWTHGLRLLGQHCTTKPSPSPFAFFAFQIRSLTNFAGLASNDDPPASVA